MRVQESFYINATCHEKCRLCTIEKVTTGEYHSFLPSHFGYTRDVKVDIGGLFRSKFFGGWRALDPWFIPPGPLNRGLLAGPSGEEYNGRLSIVKRAVSTLLFAKVADAFAATDIGRGHEQKFIDGAFEKCGGRVEAVRVVLRWSVGMDRRLSDSVLFWIKRTK